LESLGRRKHAAARPRLDFYMKCAHLGRGSYEAAIQAAASGCEAAIEYACTASCGIRVADVRMASCQ